MKRHLDDELNALKDKVLTMGSLAEEMIHLSMKVFLERSGDLSLQIFGLEEKVNHLQLEVDETSAKLLALYQPEASDLRMIIATMKINAELERVADQACNITQTCTYHLFKESPVKTLIEIPRMSTIAQEMIKESLDAFAKRDVALCQSVLKKDEEEDALKAKALNEIIRMIQRHPDHAKQLVDLILISRNLEKIADHATNIAEDVIFMVLGKDIRHNQAQ